ncbi:MAG: CHASE2 domain-containing protein [Saprospiraceae bacterium]|nr:CHASE2 domain-containing protein [Saprospiraceae bacterium]
MDPFNHGIQEYEITDIVYTQLSKPKAEYDSNVRIVHIGNTNREQLALMIDRIAAAGAKVIGVDVMLDGRIDSVNDERLRASIEKAGNVVLASELHKFEREEKKFDSLISTDSLFAAHASLGFINFPSNHTKTIRYFSPQEAVGDSSVLAFSMAVLHQFAPEAVEKCLRRQKDVEKIHYKGDLQSYVHYPTELVTDTTIAIQDLREVLEDKIVLMGYIAEKDTENPLKDRFYTPLNKNYAGKSIPDMYGVIIHANIISMVLEGRYIRELPEWLIWLIAVIFCYVNVFFIHEIYEKFHPAFHGITRSLQLIECMVLFFLLGILFYYFRLQIDFGIGILALLLAYDIIMIYESLLLKKIPFLQKIKDKF